MRGEILGGIRSGGEIRRDLGVRGGESGAVAAPGPREWMNPELNRCDFCNREGCVISAKKRSINWMFLLLGKMLGCCTLEQLKYFCKHTENHRTGAKDRVLFLTYLSLCKQMDPSGPYDVVV